MRKLIAALAMVAVLVPVAAWAQAFQPNETGVTMGHWHLNTRDIEANKKIFVAMGGTAIKMGAFDVVRFPGVLVYLHMNQAPPPTGGTVGSAVNHVGFIVQNVAEATARWKAAGVAVLPGGNGRTDQAFVVTPDELRVEILENKAQPFPIQHHHVHVYLPKDKIAEAQAWYAKWFGAKPGMRGQNVAADLPGVNLSFTASETPTVTTKGRVLDHIGFDITNLEAFTKKLEAGGVKLDRPFTRNPQTGGALAFISDPWGVYIELNERPGAQYIGTR
ncbi:MAG: VOC family protein [Acidobacteria bacterium]|nr:VOC family protein [Acidobacteriota bacterium]